LNKKVIRYKEQEMKYAVVTFTDCFNGGKDDRKNEFLKTFKKINFLILYIFGLILTYFLSSPANLSIKLLSLICSHSPSFFLSLTLSHTLKERERERNKEIERE
jgi:hypothetical protein